MSLHDSRGEWLPLMDYAIKKGVSLSTLRRHIKAKKVDYRIENGRYLIFDCIENGGITFSDSNESASSFLKTQLEQTETDLQKAREEIAELKTLIALYEEKLPHPRLDR